MTLDEIKTQLQTAGVVGAGGAGFPAYAKLASGADTLILNCAECEPLLTLHRQLLADKSVEIISALSEIGKALGVKRCVIGIKSSYKTTLEAIAPVVAEFDNVEIKTLKEMYPAGDEIVLIYQVTGRRVDAGALPISQGVIVYNVETVYNAYCALHRNKAVTDKLVTVACEVKKPQTVRVPLGTKIDELVKFCGGATVPEPVYISGGAMMGKIVSGNDAVTKTTNAILVLSPEHAVVKSKRRNPAIDAHRAASACCQCRMCSELCPRHLLGHPIDPARFMLAIAHRNLSDTEAYYNALYCSGCGLCESYSCMQGLSPRVLLDLAKRELRAGGIKPEVKKAEGVHPARDSRRAPVERLSSRLDLARYNVPAPLSGSMKVKSVRVPLCMHIGAPSEPVVKAGDKVTEGSMIAKPAKGLSVAIHAPISGTVKLVGKDIYIES